MTRRKHRASLSSFTCEVAEPIIRHHEHDIISESPLKQSFKDKWTNPCTRCVAECMNDILPGTRS
jgi:hypothetical protein